MENSYQPRTTTFVATTGVGALIGVKSPSRIFRAARVYFAPQLVRIKATLVHTARSYSEGRAGISAPFPSWRSMVLEPTRVRHGFSACKVLIAVRV
jgi:hypothetical protein